MNESIVEAVQEKADPNPFPIDVLIHFATQAWESLNRAATMRAEEPEVALGSAIGLLELIETDKQHGIEWYRKVGTEYKLVRSS